MRARIDGRMGYTEFEGLSYQTDESLWALRDDIVDTIDSINDPELRDALRPLTKHFQERSDAFGTMVLLTFQGSDAGWEAATRTYLAIIAPETTAELSDLIRRSPVVAGLGSGGEEALDALLSAVAN